MSRPFSPIINFRSRHVGHVVVTMLMSCAALLALPACTGPKAVGELTLRTEQGSRETFTGEFDTGLYSYDGSDTVTIVLVQGPLDRPKRAVTMRLFWQPAAGSTPVDPNATNATVRYIRFKPAEDEAGGRDVTVYSGAGFMYPRTAPASGRLEAGLWHTTLRLTDASAGERATPGESVLTGRFTVQRDDARVLRVLRQLNSAVTSALQYPRMVRADVDRANVDRAELSR